MNLLARIFKRESWGSYGIGHPREAVKDAMRAIGGVGHGWKPGMLDGEKPIRCLDWNKREKFLRELRSKFGKLPKYDFEKFNCNHEYSVRHGQACELWAELSDGHEALGMGWCHLKYKDATRSHYAWIWIRDNLTIDTIQYRSLGVVERPIEAIYGIGQA